MRRWYVWVTVSVALLGLLVWRTRPWEALATGADWRLLAIVVLLNVVVIGAWAVRSERLLAAVGQPLPVMSLVPVVAFANTINNLTPASSGEALRAVILRRRHGIPYDRSTAVIIAERFWAIWIMGLTAGAAAVGTVIPAGPLLIAAAWLLALVACFAPSLAYHAGVRPGVFVARLIDPARAETMADAAPPGRRQRLGGLLRDVDENLAGILATPSVAAGFVGSTGIVFATSAVQFTLILLALGQHVSASAAWAALGLGTIAGVISALPFGLGAADVVMTGLLVILGVPASVAGAAALLLRVTVTLPLGLAGSASWITLSRGPEAASANER